MTESDVLEQPSTSDADTGDNDDVFHYVDKSKIVESAVMGTMVHAICGAVFPVTKTPKPNSPVCSRCQEIYDNLSR